MRSAERLLFVILGVVVSCGESGAGRTLLVDTEYGTVEGFEQSGVHSFRGIPYAAPPVGDLRWKAPQSPEAWTDILPATETPPQCPQEAFGGLPVPGFDPSEDCLYLNVDTPAEGLKLPVMVWIHGGGFTIGEGLQADGGTAGDRIARERGVVVVSMNYRLAQFGFMAHADLSAEDENSASGHYALLDQRVALQWVQSNIEGFGGDPDNVTIFGESAGGLSVCAHLASAQSSGLFHRAIIQSGSCEFPFPTLAGGEAQGETFAEVAGCTDAAEGELACMRALSTDDVLNTLTPGGSFGLGLGDVGDGVWVPIIDGHFLKELPEETFASGDFNKVPTMVGFTEDEATLFIWLAQLDPEDPLVVDEDNYEALIDTFIRTGPELAADAAEQYPLESYAFPEEALIAAITDSLFRCRGRQLVRDIAPHAPAFLYQFEYQDGHSQLETALGFGVFGAGASLPEYGLGAFHSADIAYVFGYDPLLEIDVSSLSFNLAPWTDGTADETLWLEMMGYWTRFADTGDPNGEGAVVWPAYTVPGDEHLVLDAEIQAAAGAAAEACTFWEGKNYPIPAI